MYSVEFNRSNINIEQTKINLVDSDEETGVEMFCYNSCSNGDNYFVKQCRGIVFQGEKLVMKAMPYTDEFVNNSADLETIFSDFSSFTFFPSYEGALLRVFNVSGKWYLSTHRKLDAFRSKWACRDSFGELFIRALEHEAEQNERFVSEHLGAGSDIITRFQNRLDVDKQYMFLLRNTTSNRIVCNPPDVNEPLVFHVGTFVEGKLCFSVDCGIPRPEKLSFINLDEMKSFVNNINPRKIQGVICFGPHNQNFKVLHPDYSDLFQVRGNEPSVKFRYLQVRNDGNLVKRLMQLYPEFVSAFEDYEKTLNHVAQRILKAYIDRFIRKEFVVVSREEFQVVSACHTWHLTDKARNRINIDKVKQVLYSQSPVALNHMIKNYKNENSLGYPTNA